MFLNDARPKFKVRAQDGNGHDLGQFMVQAYGPETARLAVIEFCQNNGQNPVRVLALVPSTEELLEQSLDAFHPR